MHLHAKWCRFRRWAFGWFHTGASRVVEARQAQLGCMVQQLRSDAPFEPAEVGRTAYLFVRLLRGLEQLATKGQLRMERDGRLLERLSTHVRELGLIAGMDHLPFERVQRWMEDRMVLEGVMTGIIGELAVSNSAGFARHVREPLMHLAVFEQLCALTRSGDRHRVGRITVKPLQDEVMYVSMVDLGEHTAMDEVARLLWEIDKLVSLTGGMEAPRSHWDGSIFRIELKLPA